MNTTHTAGNCKTVQLGTITHVKRELRIRENVLEGGAVIKVRESVEVGRERVEYVATVNLTDLEAMAHQAARNKTGICRDGGLVVKVTRREAI